jgi:3-isopropylmalate/(R)-2-methylmalate dehydratase large subunit
MAIEGGAIIGYVNPDRTIYDYLKGRRFVPEGKQFDTSLNYWESIKSDKDADYDDVKSFNAYDIEPMVTWGIAPDQAIPVNGRIPNSSDPSSIEALTHMKLKAGQPIEGTKVDVVFIGSCTNGRLQDFREAAAIIKGRKVAKNIKALAVPGSMLVKKQAEAEGLHYIFIDAGFEWRMPGCSMCLAMNPDKLVGDELCVSTSNRNFIGRQGSPKGRTILASPATVAAAAIAGEIVDVRKL